MFLRLANHRLLDYAAVALLVIVVVCGVSLGSVRAVRPIPKPAAPDVTKKEALPALPSRPLPLTGAALKGNKTAPVGLMLFSDFYCPYCASVARDTLPGIEAAYVSTGKVIIGYRHLPLLSLHPLAMRTAIAANCADLQGRFWDMHDELFLDPRHLNEASLEGRAVELGMSLPTFRACMAAPVPENIQADLALAADLKITSTPTFLLGPIIDGGLLVAARFDGSMPADRLGQAIDRVLVERQTTGSVSR